MRITIDLTSLADNFSGFERFALNIAKELLILDKENYFILIFKEKVYPEFQMFKDDSRVEVVVLPRKEKLWFYQVTLYCALKKIESDIYFFPAFPSPLLFRKRGIINTIHDMGCWDCPETMVRKMVYYFRIMYRNAAQQSERIVTVSRFSKKRIQEILNVDSDKISVVYNGVSEDLYANTGENWELIKEKYNIPDNYLMCLSTLEPRKNLKLLIRAYDKLVRETEHHYNLVLAGRKGWKMDDLMDSVSELCRSKIHFTGYVEDKDLALLYTHAELFIFPSLYEGFGIPPLEAMACGCKVISSDADVMKEVLSDYVVYFRNNDKKSLENVLNRCLNGKIVFKNKNDLIKYSRGFTYKRAAERLENLIEELL